MKYHRIIVSSCRRDAVWRAGRAKTPVQDERTGGRRAPEAAGDGARGGGRGDQRPAGWFRCPHQNLWHVGTDLVSARGLTREFDGRRRKRVLARTIRE